MGMILPAAYLGNEIEPRIEYPVGWIIAIPANFDAVDAFELAPRKSTIVANDKRDEGGVGACFNNSGCQDATANSHFIIRGPLAKLPSSRLSLSRDNIRARTR